MLSTKTPDLTSSKGRRLALYEKERIAYLARYIIIRMYIKRISNDDKTRNQLGGELFCLNRGLFRAWPEVYNYWIF